MMTFRISVVPAPGVPCVQLWNQQFWIVTFWLTDRLTNATWLNDLGPFQNSPVKSRLSNTRSCGALANDINNITSNPPASSIPPASNRGRVQDPPVNQVRSTP